MSIITTVNKGNVKFKAGYKGDIKLFPSSVEGETFIYFHKDSKNTWLSFIDSPNYDTFYLDGTLRIINNFPKIYGYYFGNTTDGSQMVNGSYVSSNNVILWVSNTVHSTTQSGITFYDVAALKASEAAPWTYIYITLNGTRHKFTRSKNYWYEGPKGSVLFLGLKNGDMLPALVEVEM